MARQFITGLELDFIDSINHELIQYVSGQTVMYYAISIPETRVNDLYNEAVKKVWSPPVEVAARVLWDNPTTLSTGIGMDANFSLEVYFHTKELRDRNVVPHEGDFIEYGQVFFEISSVTQPQLVFGQIQDKIMTKCVCVPAREGQFQAGNLSSENIDNSHPIENSVHVNR